MPRRLRLRRLSVRRLSVRWPWRPANRPARGTPGCRRLARARLPRLGPRPPGPAQLWRGGLPVRCAHRHAVRYWRADIPGPGLASISGANGSRASVRRSGITPVGHCRKPRAGAVPRHWRRGRLLSLGHTPGSPTPADLLFLGLSCSFVTLGHGGAAHRTRWSPPSRPGTRCSAARPSLRRLRPSRSHLTTTTLKPMAANVQPSGTVSSLEVIVRC